MYDGIEFVANQKDVIVVSFNYRLNIFGFPTTPAIEHRNVGLLDQRAAVEWVSANIGAFGGDPERFVLAGQSAGAISTSMYAFAYPDEPLVSGMIMMSGQPETNLRDDGEAWRQVAERTGCSNRNRTMELECLRGLEPRALKRGISNANIIEYGDLTGGSPTVDNGTVFTTEGYVERGYEGRFAKVVSDLKRVSMMAEADHVNSQYGRAIPATKATMLHLSIYLRRSASTIPRLTSRH